MPELIDLYIEKLINNTPTEKIKQYKNNTIIVDIVFEGGLFNGSYESGFMYYLKTIERLKYIKIDKLSGCSIGSIISLLYFVDVKYYDKFNKKIYTLACNKLKKEHNLNIFDNLFKMLSKILPDDIIKQINNRLYISYFNIKSKKHIVKSNYKNVNELFDTIRRSCSVPLVIDNNMFYNKKYIDGLHPYIFPKESNKSMSPI